MTDSAWIFHSVDREIQSNYTFSDFWRVPFDSAKYATPGMYDPGDPTRLTVVNDGVHIVMAQASFHDSIRGDYGIAIRKNGSGFVAEFQPGANGQFWPALECVAIVRCVAGDYFQVHVGQQTGAPRTLGSDGTWFTIARIPDETGGTGGGLTEAQVRQIARDEISRATIAPAPVV